MFFDIYRLWGKLDLSDINKPDEANNCSSHLTLNTKKNDETMIMTGEDRTQMEENTVEYVTA
jgi:hypothetical protein